MSPFGWHLSGIFAQDVTERTSLNHILREDPTGVCFLKEYLLGESQKLFPVTPRILFGESALKLLARTHEAQRRVRPLFYTKSKYDHLHSPSSQRNSSE